MPYTKAQLDAMLAYNPIAAAPPENWREDEVKPFIHEDEYAEAEQMNNEFDGGQS